MTEDERRLAGHRRVTFSSYPGQGWLIGFFPAPDRALVGCYASGLIETYEGKFMYEDATCIYVAKNPAPRALPHEH